MVLSWTLLNRTSPKMSLLAPDYQRRSRHFVHAQSALQWASAWLFLVAICSPRTPKRLARSEKGNARQRRPSRQGRLTREKHPVATTRCFLEDGFLSPSARQRKTVSQSRFTIPAALGKSAGAILSNRPVSCLNTMHSRSGSSARIKRSYSMKFARVRV